MAKPTVNPSPGTTVVVELSAQRGGVQPPAAEWPNPEVPAKATRRRFTAEYKLRILREAEARATEPGAIGTLLRREGLYSTHLTKWRRQR